MKILAFGASTSSTSINQRLAKWAAHSLARSEDHVQVISLRDFPLPLYSSDLEKEGGIPETVVQFDGHLAEADVIVISFAEHNGSYTAAFKNIFDWTSRHRVKMFEGKLLVLLATSNGARGAQTVLEAAADRFPRHGGELVGTLSVPRFSENFDDDKGLLEDGLRQMFEKLKADLQARY